MVDSGLPFDVFISHASEDKETIARPLSACLERLGVHVWFDETVLVPGMSLSSSIDAGLSHARFGVVILSPNFLSKNWPKYELSGLKARQLDGQQIILPIWHNLNFERVLQFSPPLADMLAYNSSTQTIDQIAEGILATIKPRMFSRWLINMIRYCILNIENSTRSSTEYNHIDVGGLRSLYGHLDTFLSYQQIARHFGRRIWLRGPHSKLRLDFFSQRDFGHYNPAFVRWIHANVRHVLSDTAFVKNTTPIYEKNLRHLVVLYYKTYQFLRIYPDIALQLRQDYEEAIRSGTIVPGYYQNIECPPGENALLCRIVEHLDHDDMGHSNKTASAIYFWIRRSIDGTSELFFNMLVDILNTYDNSTFVNVNDWINGALDSIIPSSIRSWPVAPKSDGR